MNIIKSLEGGLSPPVQPVITAKDASNPSNISADRIHDDHFVERDGVIFAGTHLIIDFWGAMHLNALILMERALRECVEKAGATLLHIHLHHFEPAGGISGVAVLAESHISVHTWPERDFAAFDIFMCGDTRPQEALEVLKRVFVPRRIDIFEKRRGMLNNENLL
ncbi:MAG: adenosylmethionine decarboxylase [Desulfatiglandaceae bacterium]